MDISDFFGDLKRKVENVELSEEEIKKLKLIGINKLKNICHDYNENDIIIFINVFKKNISKIIITLKDKKIKSKRMKIINECLINQLQISIDLINNYKKLYSKNKKLNFIEYLNDQRKLIINNLSSHKNKKQKINSFKNKSKYDDDNNNNDNDDDDDDNNNDNNDD